jgi:hypothetical protein
MMQLTSGRTLVDMAAGVGWESMVVCSLFSTRLEGKFEPGASFPVEMSSEFPLPTL